MLSGCLSGRVSKALEESRPQDAAADLDRLVQIFGKDSTYVEIQNAGLEPQQRINPQLAKLAEATGLPLVATGDVHYLLHDDARAHEALLCIQSGDSLKNPNHWNFDTDQFYFKTPAEMAHDFVGYGHALRRTLEVAERCTVTIETDRLLLPKFPTPNDRDAFEYLVELCEAGLKARYPTVTDELPRPPPVRAEDDPRDGLRRLLPDRLGLRPLREGERRRGRPGPRLGGRQSSPPTASRSPTSTRCATGCCSSASSTRAASRCRTWTSTSPSGGRERVIDYVSEKYGRDRVAQIITFSTMMARAAVRDAGRVLEVPYGTVDRIAKMIPEGPKVYLDDNLKPGQELKTAYDADPLVREIVDLAKPLEGLVRADSIHAAGVVIGDRPLIEYVPLQQKGPDSEVVTQFSMGDVEKLGLLKIDFLGLRNLDVIDKAVELIGDLDIETIPLDDTKTYAMLRTATRSASSSSSRRACARRSAR